MKQMFLSLCMLTGMLSGVILVPAPVILPEAGYTLQGQRTTTWADTKDFTNKVIDVPAPGVLESGTRIGGDVAEIGTHEFYLALVDNEGKLSPLSDPVTVTASLRSWQVMYQLPDYPVWKQFAGSVLFTRRITPFVDPAPPAGSLDFEIRPAGCQPNCGPANVSRPVYPVAGTSSHIYRHLNFVHKSVRWHTGALWPKYEDNTFWKKSSILTTKPELPPIIQLMEFPNKRCKVAISHACNQGESPLSQELVIEQSTFGRNTHHQNVPFDGFSSGVRFRYLGKRETGALGYYVYVKFEEANGSRGKWIRQPAPHVVGNPTSPDDYLWPLSTTDFNVNRYVNTNVQPATTGGKSTISPLQQALDSGVGHVLVTDHQTIYCPIVNELYNGRGTTVGRWIQSPHAFPWDINTVPTAGAPNSWPIWCEVALKTKIINCNMASSHCRAGLDFATVYDSSNFSARTEGLNISLTAPGYTAGIIQRDTSVSRYGHTSSENEHNQTAIQASDCVVIEGNQSANWHFSGQTHFTSTGGVRSAIITANNWMNVSLKCAKLLLTGSSQQTQMELDSIFLNLDYDIWSDQDAFRGGRCVAALIQCTEFEFGRVFCDRGFPTWFCCGSYSNKRIRLDIENWNQWGVNLTVIENPNGMKNATIKLDVTGISSRQHNPFLAITSVGRTGYVTVKKEDELMILYNFVKNEYE